MRLDEAVKTLHAAGYELVESVYGNYRKMWHLLAKELKDYKKQQEADDENWYDREYSDNIKDFIAFESEHSDSFTFSDNILNYIPLDRMKELAAQCGYLVNKPKENAVVWVTMDKYEPTWHARGEHLFEIDHDTGLRIAWHVSPIGNLDTKGIRVRSRPTDKDFDIYFDRIYLMINTDDIKDAAEMVEGEKENPTNHTYLYKILLPRNFKVFPDPTTKEGVFVTNNIPPKYVTKLTHDEAVQVSGCDFFDYEWDDKWLTAYHIVNKQIEKNKKNLEALKHASELTQTADGIKL